MADAAAAAAGDAAEQLLHLKLAFLAREPQACVLTLARKAGGGSVTPHVQNFILESCIGTNVGGDQNYTYVTTVLKKVIAEAELSSDIVIDGIYEEFGRCMSSKANNSALNLTDKIYKEISFLSPTPTYDNVSSKLVSMVARLSCSVNMLEGDTGGSLWPSSLFLSEFILSYPKIFSNKCCFELGSGVGLVGVCLNYVGASKVILTDGDASTLTNMKANMEMNNLCIEQEDSQVVKESKNKFCVPHLVRVLSMLLGRDNRRGKHINVATNEEASNEVAENAATGGPVAYMAAIIRNLDTFNCFAKAAADANLSVINITNSEAPSNFLPYMLSFDRSSLLLLKITYLS